MLIRHFCGWCYSHRNCSNSQTFVKSASPGPLKIQKSDSNQATSPQGGLMHRSNRFNICLYLWLLFSCTGTMREEQILDHCGGWMTASLLKAIFYCKTQSNRIRKGGCLGGWRWMCVGCLWMNRQAELEVFFRLETGNWEVDWKGRRELENRSSGTQGCAP